MIQLAVKKLLLILFISTNFSVLAADVDTLYVKPNPCDSFTTIYFSISQTDTITLDVYNRWGQSIKSFFDSTILPAGSYSITYITDTLQEGVYVVGLKRSSKKIKGVSLTKLNNTVGITNIEKKSTFSAYPNPVKNALHLDLEGNKTIVVTDINGKEVYRNSSSEKIIDLSILSVGTYILSLYNDKDEIVLKQKLIKID